MIERELELNLSIFEIYDELQTDYTAEEQEAFLTYAYN